METPLQSLEGIEHLSSLEFLDLYETELADISLLNQLPNLKEVNLATGVDISRFTMEAQLDKPEVARYFGLPRVHFGVWERLEL